MSTPRVGLGLGEGVDHRGEKGSPFIGNPQPSIFERARKECMSPRESTWEEKMARIRKPLLHCSRERKDGTEISRAPNAQFRNAIGHRVKEIRDMDGVRCLKNE